MKTKNAIFISAFLLVLLFSSIYVFRNQGYNPDIVPYMVLALDTKAEYIELLHSKVYQDLKENCNAKDFQFLISRHDSLLYKSPTYLKEQLSAFAVKIAYVHAVSLFHSMGFTASRATIMPNLIGIGLLYWLVVLFFSKWLTPYVSSILAMILVLQPPILLTAVLSTPDVMAISIFLSGIYIYIQYRNWNILILFFFFTVLTRIDSILWISALSVLLLLHRIIKLKQILMLLGSVILAYMISASFANRFETSNILSATTLLDYLFHSPGSHFNDYLSIVLTSIKKGAFSFTYLLIGYWLYLFIKINKVKPNQIFGHIALATAFLSILRFVLHPHLDDRFFILYHIILPASIIYLHTKKEKINPVENKS